eukprot:CAMPEP_0117537210 /NCGR_PEP_ID=MMETSP0784-20121206/41847_1 /TAXON_ID=39447 /ORGANISM="" /LENGTH=179 /DNA_ID=CAMNT_0005333789 /DNA_START=91 /DNA_END=626 /DNA_ORIENTATION=-
MVAMVGVRCKLASARASLTWCRGMGAASALTAKFPRPTRAQVFAPRFASRGFSAATVPSMFTNTHEWIVVEEPGKGIVGISDFAQDQLGEVQAVGLPSIGEKFKATDEMVSIESVKTISSCNAVTDCEIIAVNSKLEDDPSLINSSPEQDGWIVKVRFTADLAGSTMTREAYLKGVDDG